MSKSGLFLFICVVCIVCVIFRDMTPSCDSQDCFHSYGQYALCVQYSVTRLFRVQVRRFFIYMCSSVVCVIFCDMTPSCDSQDCSDSYVQYVLCVSYYMT